MALETARNLLLSLLRSHQNCGYLRRVLGELCSRHHHRLVHAVCLVSPACPAASDSVGTEHPGIEVFGGALTSPQLEVPSHARKVVCRPEVVPSLEISGMFLFVSRIGLSTRKVESWGLDS